MSVEIIVAKMDLVEESHVDRPVYVYLYTSQSSKEMRRSMLNLIGYFVT